MILTTIIFSQLNIKEPSFKETYSDLIKRVESRIHLKCKNQIVKIDYVWMPKEIEGNLLKNEYARYNYSYSKPWIEFSSIFKELTIKDKELNLYHEIGHVYGLGHSMKGIMSSPIKEVTQDWNSYFSRLCSSIVQKK
jgi:hypothetical protein